MVRFAAAAALALGLATGSGAGAAHAPRYDDQGGEPAPHTNASVALPHTVAHNDTPLSSPTPTSSQTHNPNTAVIPQAEPGELVVVPWIPGGGAGTHDHQAKHNSHAPVLAELNETNLFLSSGPIPLSYIEWDFAYAMGRDEEVARFAGADVLARPDRQMGQVEGIWRTMVDSNHMSDAERAQVERRIASYVPNDGRIRRHKSLMVLHVVGCVLATLVLCPLGTYPGTPIPQVGTLPDHPVNTFEALALKAGHSSLAPFMCLVYLLLLGGSVLLGQLYNALTPPLYPSNSHGKIGHVLFWLSLAALGKDVFQLILQISRAIRSVLHSARFGPPFDHTRYSAVGNASQTGWMSIVRVALGQDQTFHPGKHGPLLDEHESMLHPLPHDLEADPAPERSTLDELRSSEGTLDHQPHLNGTPSNSLYGSPSPAHAKLTCPVSDPPKQTSIKTKLCTVARYTHVVINRSLPLIGFCCAYTGLAIYTGTCRGKRVNTCAAHGAKGAIFFWYGLLTWARYLGVYAEFGWAWNRKPTLASSRRTGISHWRRNVISGEFIECMVIFIYGITNTWMERFGSNPGDPYTIKQIQHISVAVMFWFGGLVGLFLEVRRMRDLFNFAGVLNHPSSANPSDGQACRRTGRSGAYSLEGIPARDAADELVNAQVSPPSYSSSFNPFPAVIIGLTGSAMAAHHQDYQYEVQIHVLWGNLLAAFGLFRLLTYVFLWLRPPTSILPSRPPTEALAAFCLAGGGLAFMLSSEEVSFAAMRGGYDDVMAILCFLVSVVCFCFCFTAVILLVKNWSLRREYLLSHRLSCKEGTSAPSGAIPRAGTRFTSCPTTIQEEVPLKPLESTGGEPVFVLEEDTDHLART